MTELSWKTLRSKIVRSLFLTASSAFVIVCGCGAALANETVSVDAVEGEEIVKKKDLAEAQAETSAESLLRVPSRFGVGASTSSAGFDEIFEIDAFVPLGQSVGDDITFLEGSAQLNGGNLGVSLNLGYRDYDLDEDELDGGYLGLDGRMTDNSTFYQMAAGYEHIEDDWELRINGYVPLGSTKKTIQSTDIDDDIATSSTFVENELVLSAVGERQRISQQENALGGVDLEVGTQLDEWFGGELMGFVGAYFLSGEESSLGGQARLLANFESNFNAGLSIQHDGLFGTSMGLSVSASLPGLRFHREGERSFQEDNEVAIRLRDPVMRRPNVAVNVIEDVERIAVDETAVLRNPEEEEDYRFLHVDLAEGTGAGEGTYESPFGAVEDAIALINTDPDTFSDGNTVVYVDGENALAAIPGFSVPDRVRVLSQGPMQTIAGMAFPGFPSTVSRLPFSAQQNFNVASDAPNANGIAVLLPDSDDGIFPVISGGSADLVTLGNSTVLAGFELQGAGNHGVTADGVDNVELRNNLIEDSAVSGIAFNNVGGNIVLLDNEINRSGDRGIFMRNSQTDHSAEVTIAGFDLDQNRVGMEFVAEATAGTEFPSQRISIRPSTAANTSSGTPNDVALQNRVLNSTDEGIVVRAFGDGLFSSNSQEAIIAETTVQNSGSVGIRLGSESGAHSQEFNILESTVTQSGSHGIEVINGDPTAAVTASAAVQEFVLRDSTVSENAGNGIDVSLANAGAQEVVIRGNEIINNDGDGIRSIAEDVSVQEWRTDAETGDAGISENTIAGNDGQAIVVELIDSATIPIISIVDNEIADGGIGPDIDVISTSTPGDSAAACIIIGDNLAPMGIRLTGADVNLTGSASVLVQDLETLLADPNVEFLSDLFGMTSESEAPFAEELNRCIP